MKLPFKTRVPDKEKDRDPYSLIAVFSKVGPGNRVLWNATLDGIHWRPAGLLNKLHAPTMWHGPISTQTAVGLRFLAMR